MNEQSNDAAGIVEAAAEELHRTLVPSPRPWAEIRENLREHDRATARAVLAVVLSMVAEIGEREADDLAYQGYTERSFGARQAAARIRSLALGRG